MPSVMLITPCQCTVERRITRPRIARIPLDGNTEVHVEHVAVTQSSTTDTLKGFERIRLVLPQAEGKVALRDLL